ncbi:MAG: hypothetical protein EXR47_00880 [Dehalococcoidia bacterium]|nr:hypothetical protein [Dehalococcoidia bacterium]
MEDLDAEKEGKSGKSGLMRIGAAVLGILGGIINLFAPMLGLSEGVDPFMTPEFVFLMILALMAITGGILSLTKNLMVGTALRVLGGPGAFAFFLAAVTFTPGWGDNAAIVIVGFIFTVPAALLALGATLWNAF